MHLISALGTLLNGRSQSRRVSACRPIARFRPQLDGLEDRFVLSTLMVSSAADDGSAGTLRAEIALAQSGDTITFDAGLSGQTITLSGTELYLNKNLTIQGLGASALAISAGSQSRVFEVIPNVKVTLSGMTIENGEVWTGDGAPAHGGGVLNGGTLTLSGDTLSGNTVPTNGAGGGIDNYGTVTISSSTVSHNTGGNGGGIANETGGTLTLNGSTVSANFAVEGGGIYNDGTMTLSGCTVTQNSTGGLAASGGGIYNDRGGNLSIDNSVVTGNSPEDVVNLGKWSHRRSTIGTVYKF